MVNTPFSQRMLTRSSYGDILTKAYQKEITDDGKGIRDIKQIDF